MAFIAAERSNILDSSEKAAAVSSLHSLVEKVGLLESQIESIQSAQLEPRYISANDDVAAIRNQISSASGPEERGALEEALKVAL
ncbi:hypothetical protein ABTM85_19790, partial [Acinetobacter baumannii]